MVEALGSARTIYSVLEKEHIEQVSLIERDYKLIVSRVPQRAPELYDHRSDPNETVDLFEKMPIVASYLMALLRPHESRVPLESEIESAPLSEEMTEQLRAQGYL